MIECQCGKCETLQARLNELEQEYSELLWFLAEACGDVYDDSPVTVMRSGIEMAQEIVNNGCKQETETN